MDGKIYVSNRDSDDENDFSFHSANLGTKTIILRATNFRYQRRTFVLVGKIIWLGWQWYLSETSTTLVHSPLGSPWEDHCSFLTMVGPFLGFYHREVMTNLRRISSCWNSTDVWIMTSWRRRRRFRDVNGVHVVDLRSTLWLLLLDPLNQFVRSLFSYFIIGSWWKKVKWKL